MTAYREPGMDHDLYPFAPAPDRPVLRWPDRARVAVSIVLYLEHWELSPPAAALKDPRFKDPFGDFAPDYRTYSLREYGNRVGIFRVIEALDRLGWPVTVATNSSACKRYPYLIEQCVARGWEISAHGTHATRMVSARMDAAEERQVIAECLAALEQATGARPTGWIAQDFGHTARTPSLLAEAGLSYVADWPNDDQPYWLSTEPRLLSIPAQPEWDDVQLLWHRRILTPRFPAMIEEAMSVLHAEGGESRRSFRLAVHPWLFGMPHRSRYLGDTLERLAAFDGLWPATLADVATYLAENPSMVP